MRHAANLASEDLVEPTPSDVQVGENRPATARIIWLGPLCDARFGAVGDEPSVGVDVGDERVELLLCVRKCTGGVESLRAAARSTREAEERPTTDRQ